MDTTDKKTFDTLMRFRVPGRLKVRLARIAGAKAKTLPEVCREACMEYAEKNKESEQVAHNPEAA